MSQVKANAQAVFDAVSQTESVRAVLFQAMANAFRGSTTEASPRSGLIGGMNMIVAEFETALNEATAALNDALEAAANEVDDDARKGAEKAAKAAYTEAMREPRAVKNRKLQACRIYGGQWLNEQQHPPIASGVKPKHEGLSLSIEVDDASGTVSASIGSPKRAKTTSTKAKGRKATKRVAAKAASVKGADSSTKAHTAETLVRDCLENWFVDPCDEKLQTALASAMETYRKQFKSELADAKKAA